MSCSHSSSSGNGSLTVSSSLSRRISVSSMTQSGQSLVCPNGLSLMWANSCSFWHREHITSFSSIFGGFGDPKASLRRFHREVMFSFPPARERRSRHNGGRGLPSSLVCRRPSTFAWGGVLWSLLVLDQFVPACELSGQLFCSTFPHRVGDVC